MPNEQEDSVRTGGPHVSTLDASARRLKLLQLAAAQEAKLTLSEVFPAPQVGKPLYSTDPAEILAEADREIDGPDYAAEERERLIREVTSLVPYLTRQCDAGWPGVREMERRPLTDSLDALKALAAKASRRVLPFTGEKA